MEKTSHIEIADYDESKYDYTSFWKDRAYEDQSEKRILQKLLPESGEAILDIGGGYGRLAPLYVGRYKRAVILDYSQSSLDKAHLLAEQKDWKNLQTRRGNAYQLPFANQEFDTVLMVRVLHHLEKPEVTLGEINRVLKPGGVLILEMANKIHLKARLKQWLQGNFKFTRQESPQKIDAGGGIILNYHPDYVRKLLEDTSFSIEKKRAASNLRIPFLKKFLPLRLHLLFDSIFQLPFSTFNFAPSLLLRCRKQEW